MTMLRRIVLIGGAGVLGAAGLALVQIRVGSLFGVSGQLDAFFVGAALPSVLLAIGAASISSLVVPRLPRDDPEQMAAVAGRMAIRASLIGILTAAAVVAASPLIVRLVGPGLEPDVLSQAARVLRIYALSIPGTAAAFVYASYGYASGRVWASGLSIGTYALVWLGLLFVPELSDNVESATLAGLIATAVQVLAAYLFSSAGVPRPRPRFDRLRIGRAGVGAITLVLAATVAARAGLLLDPLFGSLLPEGSVSLLAYAARIAALAIFVCGQGAAFSLLVVGAEAASERAAGESRVGLVAPLLLATSAAAVLIVCGPQLSELILARGELSVAAAREVGELLRIWAIAVVPFTLVWALEALLYAERRVREVLDRALVALAVNAAASGALVAAIGIDGRPLGVLCGVAVQLGLLVALFWEDPRFAALKSRSILQMAFVHAAAVAAAATLSFVVLRDAGSADLGAIVAIGVSGAISLAFVRAYQARQLPLAEDGRG